MTRFSVLDLSPIIEGGTVADALKRSLDLAVHTESLGFHRYWVAEHHNMPGIASAATAVVIGHLAQGTSRMRIGAGGIMLPNHAPITIAEQFGTLAALFPNRIDLGIGRAPGTDRATMRALRRHLHADTDQRFPADVIELLDYLGTPDPARSVHATPGQDSHVPVYILGSSLFGATLAANLGLPFAFASHFAPAALMPAIKLYKDQFKPSNQLDEPYIILGYNVCAAESTEEAEYLRTSSLRALLNLRQGRPMPLSPPDENFISNLSESEQHILTQTQTVAAVGDGDVVHQKISSFLGATGANELIIITQIHNHQARLASYNICAQVVAAI